MSLAIDFFKTPTLKNEHNMAEEQNDVTEEGPDPWYIHLFTWGSAAMWFVLAYGLYKIGAERGSILLLVGSFGVAALGIQMVFSGLKALKTKNYQESLAVFWSLILGLPAVFLLVLFVVKFFGWTTSAPSWAAVIIVLLIAILFKR
jgi:hypothetical protein